VTLRARLTAAFLAVVLGPVLLGAIFVGATVSGVNADRATERLDLAGNAVRSAINALCQQLLAAAQSAALLTAGGQDVQGAQLVVDQGLAAAVRVTDATGATTASSDNGPVPPWLRCGQPSGNPTRVTAIAARVEMHDEAGALVGYAYAAQTVDSTLLGRLAAASGASVTLLARGGADPLSTERSDRARQVARTAGPLDTDTTGQTSDGRYVRRLAATVDQPLPLAVSVARVAPDGLYAVLVGLVLLVAVLAVLIGWWLARGTTMPLAELAATVERVAGGDLAARVPVRGQDEVGRLAGTFNRMTREMQSYVAALTASRDQLRGHLAVLGDTLSSTHDVHRILEVILQTARSATGAASGVVLLVEDDEVLVGDPAQGLPSGDHVNRTGGTSTGGTVVGPDRRLRVPLGGGLLGSVASTGEPRRGRVERDGPALVAQEPVCRTYMAVPLRGPDSVRGVLALYDRIGDDEFDDADLVTLRTFAGQAAIAVENVRMHEEAQRLSHTDSLTGLYNYRTLKSSLRREVERANRFGRQLCVLVLDLDRFKEVNDFHGHAAGDAVLAEFARRLRGEIREVDLAFRHGGEEFALLLPETDASGGRTLAERLGTAIRAAPMLAPPRVPGARGSRSSRWVPVTVSIGVAVFPDHGPNGLAVLAAADDALYAAKAAGRDTYRVAGERTGVSAGEAAGRGASGSPHQARPARGR
jgi:diguanylate cyclase (GGDEF)-like protein